MRGQIAPMGVSILFINVTREGCVYKKILRTAGQLVMKKQSHLLLKKDIKKHQPID